MSTIDLGGDAWRLKGFLPGDWLRPDLAERALSQAQGWAPAQVPGSVQHDLWRAGELADPYVGRNSLAAEWVAERTWVYARSFVADPAWRGRRARLRFEGVDYAARFALNGAALGAHEGMLTPACFEVDELLRYDAPNELVAIIAPAPREQDQMGRTSLVRSRKSRMGYWWDFCPRLINLGLWDAVALELSGPLRIEDVWVRPALAPDHSRAEVAVTVTLSTPEARDAAVEVTLRHAGRAVASERVERQLAAGGSQDEAKPLSALELRLAVEAPRLWWPNGYGEQALYSAEVRVADAGDAGDAAGPSDERSVSFGIRSVEVVANATPDPAAPPYTFVVNGERVYINGWNWVPLDALYGVERPEKLGAVLELARRAHVNLLRVNGVGLIERADFYEQCDRLGLMIWQEFAVTSSDQDRKPSEDPDYIAAVVAEAREIVPRRRNYPALVIWCAGNELESLEKLPLDDSEALIGALKRVARELDPDRHWLPTSARGRKPFNGLPSIRRDPDGLHDVHGPWLYEGLVEQYALYNAGSSLFHSEFAVEGLTNPETLRTLLPPEELHAGRLESPAWRHLSAWWVRPAHWRDWFGQIDDLDMLVRATQMLQAEGVRYAIEANRRRIPRNSGSLPWQLNEPYPMAACTSAVDYYGRPKALYHAVAEAFAPLALSARYDTLAWAGRPAFEAELWAVSALRAPVAGATLEARVVGAGGAVYERVAVPAIVAASGPTHLGVISCPLGRIADEVFFLDMRLASADGAALAASRVCFSRAANLAPLLALTSTTLAVAAERRADRWGVELANTGARAALFVRLADGRDVRAAGHALFEANHFCLLPGERRALTVEWRGVATAERRLTIGGWNTGQALLTEEVPA
jgi:beta-mannosidase